MAFFLLGTALFLADTALPSTDSVGGLCSVRYGSVTLDLGAMMASLPTLVSAARCWPPSPVPVSGCRPPSPTLVARGRSAYRCRS